MLTAKLLYFIALRGEMHHLEFYSFDIEPIFNRSPNPKSIDLWRVVGGQVRKKGRKGRHSCVYIHLYIMCGACIRLGEGESWFVGYLIFIL